MDLNSIYTIFLKDLKMAIQDKMVLILVVIPLLLSLAMPLMSVSTDNMTAQLVVYDEGDNHGFIDHLRSIEYYNVTTVGSADKLKEMVTKGDAVAALTIPAGFSEGIKKGTNPNLSILVNPSKTKSVVFMQSYRDVIMAYSGQPFPVNITMETTENGGTVSMMRTMIVPMVILISVVLLGTSILPYTLTTEKEKKTLDAILVSPASEKDVIFGKMLFGLSLTMAIVLLAILLTGGFTGNIPVTLLYVLLGSTACVGIGLLVGSYANNYNSASVISTVIMLPMMLLPIFGSLSDDVAMISKIVPTTYMYNGVSDSLSGNGTLQGIAVGLLALVAFNVIVYALAVYMVRKRRNTA
jgi:ABC-2 type transport system permease protein